MLGLLRCCESDKDSVSADPAVHRFVPATARRRAHLQQEVWDQAQELAGKHERTLHLRDTEQRVHIESSDKGRRRLGLKTADMT